MRYAAVAMTAFASFAVLAPMTVASAGAAANGAWSDAGKLSTERADPLTTLLSDGRVLVTGVSGQDDNAIGNVDMYDPARGWSLGPKLPSDPLGAVLAPLPNGGALLAGGVPWLGGYDGPGPDPRATASVYDPASDVWTNVPDMRSRRNNATATALPDGRLLVVGGYDRRVTQLPNPTGQPFCCIDIKWLPLATTEFFDPRSRTWLPGPMLKDGRYGHFAVALHGGRVLIVGGNNQPNPGNTLNTLNSAEMFDPGHNQWFDAGSIGIPRQGYSLTVLADGRVLLAGGTTRGTTALRSTLLYDPVRNQWSPGPDLAEARSNHSAAVLKDGRVLVMGGVDPLGRLASSEVFDPSTNRWSPAGGLATARTDHAAIALQDGRVLVVGGTGSLGPLASSEVFDPARQGVPPRPRTRAGPGRWLVRSQQPFVTLSQSAQLLRNGAVLVMPAGTYGHFQVQVYDPVADKWTTPIDRTSDQGFIAGTVLADDRVLLVTSDQEARTPAKAEIIDLAGGSSRAAASPGNISSARLDLMSDGRVWLTGGPYGSRQTQFYDPAVDRWSPGPDVPSDLYLGTITPLPDGRVLVGGITKAMILDRASRSWIDVCCIPDRWEGYSATALPSGDVLFAGGVVEKAQGDPVNRLVQVASTRVMRWSHLSNTLTLAHDIPHAQSFHSTVVLANGQVLFAGGILGDAPSDPGSDAELYDPTNDSWTTVASLPVARAQASGVLLKDGRALIVGGYGMMYGAGQTLEYVPDSAPRIPPSLTAASAPYVVIEVVVTLGLLVVAVFLAVDARRRWLRRSARR